MHHIFSSSSAIATSTLAPHEIEQAPTEDVGEDIVHPAAAAAFPEALLPVAIVQLPLLGIRQHFIGKADLFELPGEHSQNSAW